MGGIGFVDISLVKDLAVKRGGCGACRKGRNGGKQDETVFWSDMKPVVVCGAAGWQKRRVDLMRRRITGLGSSKGFREVVLLGI
jgi:hypothetical protein